MSEPALPAGLICGSGKNKMAITVTPGKLQFCDKNENMECFCFPLGEKCYSLRNGNVFDMIEFGSSFFFSFSNIPRVQPMVSVTICAVLSIFPLQLPPLLRLWCQNFNSVQ